MEVILMHRRYVDHKNHTSVTTSTNKETYGKIQSASPMEMEPNQSRPSRQNESAIQGLGQFKYVVQNGTKGLIFVVEAMMNGRVPIKARTVISFEPWTQLSLYYHPGLGRIQMYDTDAVTAMAEYYVGRVVVTDTEALVYLRGRIKDIPGFKNIIVNEGESSGVAFTKYSSKVKHFLEETMARQEQLSHIDVHKQISYLEAQVDVLTKIIVNSGIVKNPEYLEVLQEADRFSMCENLDAKLLHKKMQYKKIVRGVDKVC